MKVADPFRSTPILPRARAPVLEKKLPRTTGEGRGIRTKIFSGWMDSESTRHLRLDRFLKHSTRASSIAGAGMSAFVGFGHLGSRTPPIILGQVLSGSERFFFFFFFFFFFNGTKCNFRPETGCTWILKQPSNMGCGLKIMGRISSLRVQVHPFASGRTNPDFTLR